MRGVPRVRVCDECGQSVVCWWFQRVAEIVGWACVACWPKVGR